MTAWLLPAGYLGALLAGVLLGVWTGLRHVRLRRTRKDAAEKAAKETSRRISGLIRSHLDLSDAFVAALAAVGEELRCDLAYVQLVRAIRRGPATSSWRPGGRVPSGDPGVLGAFLPLPDEVFGLVAQGRCLVVEDVHQHPAFRSERMRASVSALGIRSLLVAPISDASGVVGVVVASREQTRSFGHHEVEVVESVAWSLGRALQNRALQDQQDAVARRLEALDRSKSDFVASVSHELRTPLTSIAGYVEMLIDGDGGPVAEGQREMLDIIGRNTVRLQSLIEDLLTIGKIESGALAAAAGEVPVTVLLREVEAALTPAVSAAGLVLAVVVAPEDLVVHADHDQLEQVLLNLVGNALKFTPSGGRVTVTATPSAYGWVELVVADTGIGVPLDEQDHLFGRFFRASNATARAVQGAGLGLSIVDSIVSAHGGEVSLDSTEGRGTAVTVRLRGGSRAPAEARVK